MAFADTLKRFQTKLFGPKKEKPKKPLWREWLDALVFAGVVALLIRTFLLEAFFIPTGSMERSLLVGDFLFVSKLHYGPRMPMAPLSIPFVHNKIPGTSTKSYLDWIELPYARIPGFVDIERNDVVVFNFPAEDLMPNHPQLGAIYIPSMKENYIKRCVALPGDRIEVRAAQVYINGEKGQNPDNMLLRYQVETNGERLNPLILKEEFKFRNTPPNDPNRNWHYLRGNLYQFNMTDEVARQMDAFTSIRSIRPWTEDSTEVQTSVYPLRLNPRNSKDFPWNRDYWGPVTVPAKGQRIELTPRNVALYERVITAYEDHELHQQTDGTVLIDGEPAQTYTFEMDYHFMMGDNRYNSQDSRFWGFVPMDHVIGKPILVLLSMETGLRWGRFFTLIE